MFDWLKHFNEYFTLYLIFPTLLLLGVYLTLRLRCVQISKLKMSVATLFKKEEAEEGNISHYQAIASVLASNVGTGNISGMAIAISMGGPGALIWMWLMAFLGAAVQFASCFLGVKYRQKNAKGEFTGGPMYYLLHGLGWKVPAALFSILVILGAFAAGSFVQVNSIALPLANLGIAPSITGLTIAVLVGIVVLGGGKRFAKVSSAVVPVMAILYLGAALIILGMHVEKIVPSIQLICKYAFSSSSVVGGAVGFSVMKAVITGFDRAIFATDAGTGTVPILQSGAKTKHPVIDGVVTLIAPFLVMIVCSSTVLVLMVTGVWQNPELKSTNMVTQAFTQSLGSLGAGIVLISLFLFGYTTTLAWGSCLESAVSYLFGPKLIRLFQWIFILVAPVGAFLRVDVAWILADITLTSMLILNLIGITGLSKEVIFETTNYFSGTLKKRFSKSTQ